MTEPSIMSHYDWIVALDRAYRARESAPSEETKAEYEKVVAAAHLSQDGEEIIEDCVARTNGEQMR